jgi:hypothetical protein
MQFQHGATERSFKMKSIEKLVASALFGALASSALLAMGRTDPCRDNRGDKMKSRTLTRISAVVLFATLTLPLQLAAQDNQSTRKHRGGTSIDAETVGNKPTLSFVLPEDRLWPSESGAGQPTRILPGKCDVDKTTHRLTGYCDGSIVGRCVRKADPYNFVCGVGIKARSPVNYVCGLVDWSLSCTIRY